MHRGTILVIGVLTGCDVVWQTRAFEHCEPGQPFPTGAPVPLEGSYSVEAARFTPTQGNAYLSLCPANGDKTMCDLYTSTFLPDNHSFGLFAKMNGVSTANEYDSYPTITADGRHLLFASTRLTNTGFFSVRVWVATVTNGSFETPDLALLDVIPGATHTNEPYALPDGQTIYLSGTLANANSDLYRATGGPPGYSTAELVPGVASAGHENAPVVTDDELEIFFASNRDHPELPSLEGLDIYQATRRSPTEPFGTPVAMPALSTDGIDWPLWISPDKCDLYYINKQNDVAAIFVTHR